VAQKRSVQSLNNKLR